MGKLKEFIKKKIIVLYLKTINKKRWRSKMTNPKVKKGDIILLKKSRNGSTQWIDIPLEVVKETSCGNNYIYAKAVNGVPSGQTTIYYDGPADEFILADRKEQAKYLKERNKELIAEIHTNKAEIERLENFATEEEFVAHKLQKILKAKSEKQIVEILKTLKQSDYL